MTTFGGITRGIQEALCKDCYDDHKSRLRNDLTLKLVAIAVFVLAVAIACGTLLN